MLNKKCFLLSTDVIRYMKKEKPQKTSENEGLSIDSLNTVIDANKDLYNELNALTELEAIEKISSEEEQNTTQKKITVPSFVIFDRIKDVYYDNDLIRYALWSILLMLASTTILTVVEYDIFRADVADDILSLIHI